MPRGRPKKVVEPEQPKECPKCKGTGYVVVDEDKVPCLYCKA